MRRLFFIVPAVLLLTGISIVAWTIVGLPPVRLAWRYGLSYGPGPTGRSLTVEGIEFVEIGPGCFLMGSEKNAEGGDWLGRWCARLGLPWGDQPRASREMPVHWVEFADGFWVSKYEVTNEQFERFQPGRDRSFREGPFHVDEELPDPPGDRHPAVGVLWVDAKRYCGWLAGRTGLDIRLPSESEWEGSCRGGSSGEYCFGDDALHLADYAWYEDNCGWAENDVALGTHVVGTRRANGWGLYDFHGNAWEWCEDTFHRSYEDAPVDGSPRTERGESMDGNLWRVLRGGTWGFDVEWCRSAMRFGTFSDRPAGNIGYRVGYLGVRLAWSGW